MISADILFIKRDNFYKQISINKEEITGYELLFQLIFDFKTKFNFTIHSFSESDKTIQFNFKGDYMINVKEYSNGRYVELYSHTDNLEDFTEKFNYLKHQISMMHII